MSERNTDPIRVAPGSLTIDPLFPAPAAPRPPQSSPEQLAQVEDARQRDEDLQRWHAEQEATAPGRYSLVDEREVAARQDDWRKKNASGGVGGDVWRGLQIGADKIPRAVREVVRALPAIGPGIVAGVDAIDRWQHGRDSETFFEEKEARLRAGQTPAQQEAGRKQWVEETQNPDGSVSYSMGSAWSDPRSYLGAIVESLPGTVVTMVPAAALARGAYAGAMARGLGERAAAAAAARTATIAGGVGEGLLSGGETSAEVREAITKMPEDTLRQSEAYRSLLEAGKSPAEARAALADDRAVKGMLIAGVATGLFGGMGDRALAKIVAEGVQGGIGRRTIAGAARGAVAEGVFEELPQSVSEQVAKNYAVQGANPNQRLMEGVPNAAAGGLVVGNLMGAGMGGAGGAARPAAALPAPASEAEAKGQAVATGAVEGPTGPLSAALDYAARQGGAPTTAPAGAPPAGSEVQIRMPRGQSLPGRIEGYSPTGEPMVRAEITDPETGEITTQTLEVPLSQLAPARPIAPPPARPEMGPEIVPEIPGQAPATPPAPISGPLAAAPIPDAAPPAAPATPPVPGTEAPRDVTAEAAEPMGRIPATERSELPARKDTVPLTERPALAGPGQRVIVDDPATVGRFGATLEAFAPDGSGALVRGDGGQSYELPLDKIRVTSLSAAEQQARDLAANPPVERETITATTPSAREVRGKQLVMPDEMHARLFDFGKMRRDSKATLGRGALDLDTDRPMAEQVALAQHFGVSPQRLAQIADDYRYRVERAAKEATTRTPVKMAPVTDKMLSRMKAEDKREAAKAEDGNQPEAQAAPAVEAPAAPVGNQDVSTPAPIEAVAAAGETRELRENPAIDEAAHEAATSPTNDRPEPTQAQKEAGNYKLGHITLAGLDISIENPAGSERKGVDRDGKAWAITMKSHYGYIKGTRGRDKDHIDVFVRPGVETMTDTSPVFVVDQISPDTGRFDEHKVMLGWETAGQAQTAYLANYARGWKGMGTVTPTTIEEFKAWLESGDTTKAFASNVRGVAAADAAIAARDAQEKAAAAVRDAKETAAGRLPIEDDRARERAEKIRRAEAAGQQLVSGEPRTPPTSESVTRASKAGTLIPAVDEQALRTLLRRDGGALTPEGLEVMVWPDKGAVIVRDRDSGQLVTRKQFKDPATPVETLIDEAVRLANLQGEKKATKPRQSTEERAAELKAQMKDKPAAAQVPGPPAKEQDERQRDYLQRLVDYARVDQGRRGRYGLAKEIADLMAGEPIESTVIANKKVKASFAVRQTPLGWTWGIQWSVAETQSGGGYSPSSLPGAQGAKAVGSAFEASSEALSDLATKFKNNGEVRSAIEERMKRLTRDIGLNAQRETVKEDGRGVRYVVEDGVKIYQKTRLDGAGMVSEIVPEARFEVVGAPKQVEGTTDTATESAPQPDPPAGNSPEATSATEAAAEIDRKNEQPAAAPPPAALDFAGNKLFTADKVEAARARLRAKMRQINSGIDPETLIDGMTIAGAYIEAGVRSFSDYARRMVDDLGPNVRPYLLSFWEGTRHYPGLDTSGMTTAAESARLHQEIMNAPATAEATPAEEKADGREDTADAGDRGQLAADEAGPVRAPESERNAGDGAAGRGQPDDVGDRRADRRRDDPGRGDGEGAAGVPDADGERAADERRGSGSARRPGGDVAPRQLDAADGRGRDRQGYEARLAPPPTDPQPSGGLVAQARPTAYTITDADEIGSGGAKAKFRNNVAAIRLLQKLEEEARPATRDEQSVLAKWVGWGGLRPAFAREDGSVAKGWEKEAAELRELMTPEEYRAAESSTRNAHYTAPEIVKAMWSAVDRLGFKGGQILEPSVGAGNFLGLAPASVRATGRFTGVELDRITGRIAKNLYLDANIQAPMGYQDLSVPDGYFDLAIGNPPFGSERVHDKLNPKIAQFSIHNYFFAKSVDGLRPGGVLAMVITSRFLDGADSRARAYIAQKADLLGAIRLPNDAFLKNAGTSVTTDIVFLQRREEGATPKPTGWIEVDTFTDKEGRNVPLNRYFIDNPDMMLGDFGAYGTMYGPDEPALIAREGDNLPQLVRKAINALPANVMPAPAAPVVGETPKAPMNVRDALEGSMFLDPDGKIWRRDPDRIGEPQASLVDLGDTAAARVAQMIRIRDTFARLRAAQLDPKATDEKIENLRERLNKVYDAHVSKFGPINADANKRLFREDPTWPQISALEDNFDKGVSAAVAKTTGEAPRAPSAKKAAIFTKRTQQPYAPPTSAASAKDALAAVLSEYGRVDMRAMEQIYGQPEADIVTELGSLIFKTPAGEYETADGYLSGNVKQKLAEARRAAEQDPAFRANVAALEEVQPADIEAVDIDVKSGSPWVPANHVVDFVNHIIDGTGSKAFYSKMTASWVVTPGRASQSAQTLWATEDASINRVIDAALNHSRITISEKTADGTTIIDQAATEAANEKVEKVKAEWRRWVWEDDARRDELARLYNDTFNTDVEPRFDGSHLKLPGKVSDDIISFRPHQLNAVWRATQGGTALFDHTVGAGKTFAGIASVMELRRTGRAKKPMVVVPNHLVGQWAADFVKLYPGARVLAPTEKDFDKENRQRLFARILTSDWDAVIVAHSSFKKIGVSAEYEAAYLQHQVAQIMASMQEVRAATGEKSRNVSQLSKQRDALQTRLQKLMEGGGKDVGLVWDDLGIDALMVDEAHEFKNLGFATSMQRVAGLGNPTGSQKASDLAIKIRHLLDTTGGRNLIFLTGTPISNSMAEMFTVQRYLAGRKLEQMGLAHFDAWARVFGEVVTDWELSPTGQYKQNSRFARFTNVPELMQLYRSFADVIVNDDIKAMLAAQGKRFPLPKVKGGKPTNVVVERSPDQAEYIGIGQEGPDGQLTFPGGSLIWRAENLPKKAEKGADNMLKIMSDARKAALDMRLIGQGYGDVANSKVHRAADEMVRIYKQWDKDRGAQLVFIDLSTPQAAKAKEAERIRAIMAKAEQGDEAAQEALDNLTPDELSALDGKFSVYDDLRQKLIDRGIPPTEIAFIHSANTDLQKQELFGKVRSGRVRFLFGSTPKMGAGTNVQNRLVALHHLDAPWRPSDLEQRDGRGIRQGNELYDADPDGFEIEILRYATKNTLDARQWQTIEAKARFIEQLRKGNVKERTVEDIAGEASNAAEMKAAASGNPKILEEMTLRQRLRKLDAAMVEHDRGQHRVKGAIGASMRETNRIEELLPSMEKDAATATETLAGEFTATIRGAAMEKPSEMGLAIINAAKEMLESGAERSPVGSYGPFKLALQWVHTTSFRLAMAGALTHEISVGDVKEADPTGLSLKITNTARWLVKEPDAMRARLAQLRAELPKLQAQIGPFAQAAELAETRDQHAAILAELRPKPKPPAAAQAEGGQKDSIADGAPVATIDGTELGVEFRSGDDMPALRKAALAWYQQHLRGSTVLMKDGTEVQFSQRGRNKTVHGRGDLLLRAIPAIPEIIRNGDVVLTEPGTVARVEERRVVAAAVNLMGDIRRLAVSIHRQADGHWQYDLTFDNERTGAPAINTGGLATREGPVPALEGQRPRLAGDANTTDKDSVSAPGQDLNLMVWGEVPASSADAEIARVLAVIDRSPLGPMVRRLIAAGRVAIVSQAYDGAAPGVQAFATRDGRISLVAPMLADAKVMPVLLHEAFHAGTRRLIGDAAWSGLTDRLARLHRQFERSPGAARTFYDEAARRVRNAGISGPLSAEEFGAYAIEHYAAAPRALRGWIDDVLGRVKAWVLATFGRQVGAVTPAQLRALAVAAIRDQSRATDQIPVKSADQNPIKDSVRDAVADVAASAGAMLDQRSIVERIRGAATDIQPTLLAAVPLNYFSELKRPGMTSVDAYLRTKRDMDTYRANRHETMVTIAEDWRKFAGANRAGAESLSQLMNEATLASYDPALARPDPGNSEQIDIAKRWDALPPAAQKLYRRVRDAFVEQQNELDAVILANIDKAQLVAQRKVDQAYRSNLERVRRDSSLTEAEKRERIERLDAQRENDLLRGQWAHKARMTRLRQRFESNRLPAPYFPLTRFGRYFVTIRNSDGDVVSFSRFEREAERRRWVRENWSQIQKDIAGAVKEEGVIDQAADLGRAMDPRIIGEIDVLLGEAGVDATVMDAIWQRYLQTMPDLSIRKRFIHRKGTSGFQADALKGFASHMFHAAHQMARLKYSGDLTEALNGAADEARKSDDPTRATTLVNELRKRHQWVMNPTGSRAAQAVTSAMFAWYLAATPAAAIVNMTQPVMLGVPIIGARFGGIAKASAAMAKAAKETVNSSGSIQNSTALSSEEQAAVRAFYESGLIERTQSHDLAGIGETGVEYSPLRHKVMSKIGWMFHRAEIWNREVTALTAYRMARENGQTHREAIDTAHDLTWKVNFDYSNSNRARILQGDAMKLVGVFQNFQLNMWYRLFRDMHQSFKGETPQARTEARYQLAGIIGMMGLLGGVTGIAGYNIIMAVAGMFFGDDEDPFEFKHQVERSILNLLGPTLGGIILKGAPGHLTGIDLTSRIGMPDFFLREPSGNKEGAEWWKQLMFSAAGVVPSTIYNTIRGFHLIADGKTARGIEAVVPKAVRDVMKAYRYANEGVQSQRGDEIVPVEKISAWDLIAQVSGFTPAHISESFERNSRIRDAQTKVQRERRDLLNQFALASRLGDADTREAVLEKIRRWNTRAYTAGMAITSDTLQQSLATRQRNAARREDGVLIANQTLNRTLRDGLGIRINQ